MPRGGRKHHKQRDSASERVSNEDIEPEAEGFFQDEVEQFHGKKNEQLMETLKHLEPASSDDEGEDYSEEEDVLGIDVSDTDEEEYGEEFEKKILRKLGHHAVSSDDEETHAKWTDGPSERAWGKRKKTFYSTDFVDDELGGSGNEEAAEQEEIEAMALQRRMAAALREEDFEVTQTHNIKTSAISTPDVNSDFEVVVQDLTKLSKDDKLEILAKEFPELFELLGDYKEKLSEVIALQPLLKTARSHSTVLSAKANEWLELKVHLTLCYCTNIAFYLLLKSHQCPVKTHPVIGQLVQYRKLLSQLELAGEEVESEITRGREILAEEDGELSLITNSNISSVSNQLSRSKLDTKAMKSKKRRQEEDDPLNYYYKVKKSKEEKRKSIENETLLEEDDTGSVDPDEKRAITYQISRNKGLTPKRKKEQRNPRVKHRKKFRKAVIKRKSQVPDVINEQVRYGGELSGIRANLSRSVKIK